MITYDQTDTHELDSFGNIIVKKAEPKVEVLGEVEEVKEIKKVKKVKKSNKK